MRLHPDWKRILRKAWSVKFNIIATVFGGLEVSVAIYQPTSIPHGVFAGIAALITVAANISRILAQKEFHGDH